MLNKSEVKYIQSLSEKKFRDNEKAFIAEAPKTVSELIDALPNNIIKIFALPQWISANEKKISFLNKNLIIEINEVDLKRISHLSTPNQVVMLMKQPAPDKPDFNKHFILALDCIQDPGNLGTIIRIADWFGVSQLVCSHDCADAYNSKTIQSTMGSIARVNIFYTSLFDFLKEHESMKIFAATLSGKNMHEFKKQPVGILLIGNESKGIKKELLQFVHEQITIPKNGKAESLNAAVATGILLSYLK